VRSANAASNDFVVQSASSGGTPENSKPYLDLFIGYAQKVLSGWKPITASFYTDRKGVELAANEKHPGFGMLDVDVFLELRKQQELLVLAEVEGPIHALGHLHVVAKDPAIKSLEDLKGKVVVSNHAASPRFLSKVVFDGKIDVTTAFTLQPATTPLKGLKAVDRGEAAATIIDDQQLANMKSLPFGASLRAIFSSTALPPSPFVAFGKTAQPAERAAVQKMVLGMCSDKQGAEVCKALQITKFNKVDANIYNEAMRRFDR
jgi:ABC-type phosphate/phosphonate transport system substrate-binding protein